MDGLLNAGWSTPIRLGVVALLLTAVFVPSVAADTGAQQTEPEVDNTVTRIEVYENGSARWTIQIRTRLDTAERVDNYETFIARFEANRSRFLDSFRKRMRGVVANADNASSREMRAVRFTASATIQEVPRRWGIVTFQFTWTNFAKQSDATLTVGDVFQGGFFLARNDTLVIVAPRGYAIEEVAPTPVNRERGHVSWLGREDFPDGEPRVVFTPQSGEGPLTSSPTTAVNQATPPPTEGSNTPIWLVVAAILLAISALAFGVYWHRHRIRSAQDSQGKGSESSDETDAEAVMTDEERVLTMLGERGGRVRQSTVAEEFDWSASKTSRVVNRLVDQGTVEKLQLGRQNLLDLVDAEE